MNHSDIILLALAYSGSVKHIVGMICTITVEYVNHRIRNASQRG